MTAGFALFVRTRTPNRPDQPLREQLHPSRLRSLLSRPPVAFTTAVAGFGQFVDVATFSFLPYVLRAYVGFSSAVAGMLFTLYFVVVAVAQPAAGWLSDRFGHDPVTVGSLLVGTAGLLGLLAGETTPVIAGAVVCLGVGMGWSLPVQSRAIDLLDADEQGTGFGLIRTVYIGFASLSGIVGGGAVTLGGVGQRDRNPRHRPVGSGRRPLCERNPPARSVARFSPCSRCAWRRSLCSV